MEPEAVGGGYASVNVGGMVVSSNDESADDMQANLAEATEKRPDDAETDPEKTEADRVSKAASELGKKGAAAAAEKRAKASDDKPKAEDDAEGEETDEKPLGKPRNDPRARMLEATRQASEVKKELAAERQRRERLEAENRELRTRTEAPPAPAKPPSEEPKAPVRTAAPVDPQDPRPAEADFKDYGDYVEAMSRWGARQEATRLRGEAEQRFMVGERQKAIEKAIMAYNARLTEAATADAEFGQRISDEVNALQPTFTLAPGQQPTALNVVADELVRSEHAPALMRHLSEHPDELQRLAALPNSREVSREMAKLEGRLTAAPAGASEKPPAVSKAKPPVRPVAGSPTPAPDEGDENESFESHFNRENARDKKRRGGQRA